MDDTTVNWIVILVMFVFGSIGLTHVVVDSKIMYPVRDFLSKKVKKDRAGLLECYQCMGVWMGWLLGIMLSPHTYDHFAIAAVSVTAWASIMFGFMFFGAKDNKLINAVNFIIPILQVIVLIVIHREYSLLIFSAGFAGSFLSILAASYVNYLEARTIVELENADTDGDEL